MKQTMILLSLVLSVTSIDAFASLSTGIKISGRVINVYDKTPIAGAKVWIDSGADALSVVTNAEGNYEIAHVANTAHWIHASAANATFGAFIARDKNIESAVGANQDLTEVNLNLMTGGYTTDKVLFLLTRNNRQFDLYTEVT